MTRLSLLAPDAIFTQAGIHQSRVIYGAVPRVGNFRHGCCEYNGQWWPLGFLCCRWVTNDFYNRNSVSFYTFLGYTFSLDGGFDDQLEDESISATSTSAFVSAFASVIDYILNCGCFFYIGAWLPWEKFTSTDLGINPWRLLVLCIGILILRRIPAMLVLYRWVPEIKDKKEALFCGHFGKC